MVERRIAIHCSLLLSVCAILAEAAARSQSSLDTTTTSARSVDDSTLRTSPSRRSLMASADLGDFRFGERRTGECVYGYAEPQRIVSTHTHTHVSLSMAKHSGLYPVF